MWRVKRITDRGPSHHYRYRITGDNLFCEIPTEFRWNVPDLADGRYFLADDADNETRAAFKRAKGH
jgi:hypothetical protein